MEIKKSTLLDQLEMVKPGLSMRENLQQSSCFVFFDGKIFTFNDEIACRIETNLKITGAVTANVFLSIISKIPDEKLIISENENGELEFSGKRKRFGITRDAEILLPIEKIEEEIPEADADLWRQLPPHFQSVIEQVKTCVCKNEEFFALTCVHFHPRWVEACDSRQMFRWRMKLGLEKSFLVRGAALDQIIGLGMSHMAVTKSWIHFRNGKGLIFSCRKFTDDYPDLSEVISVQGEPLVLPKSLKEAAERAQIFAAEQVSGIPPVLTVEIRPKWMILRGDGLGGWYRESQKISGYRGKKIVFMIAPALLSHIANKYREAQITDNKLRAIGERWVYISVLSRPKSQEEREAEAAAEAAANDISEDEEEAPAPKKKKKKHV